MSGTIGGGTIGSGAIASGAVAAAPIPRFASAAHHAAPAPAHAARPLVGIAAVLLGALISTLFTRITNFGLADLRGAIHAGFDSGAWITTAATVGQMAVGPIAAWFGLAFGVRRVLMISAFIFFLVSLLTPFVPDLNTMLAAQALGGLASGTFIPLTISFVLQSLPRRLWAYGIAAYGLNLELSLNIPASLEGWYLDHLSWHWIYWQGAILAVPMLACIYFGMPKPPVNRDALRDADVPGMLYVAAGFSMLYAALDQGNRLDWLNSGLICGLLVGGMLLIGAFVQRELACPHPWINLGFLLRRNIGILITILVLYRFVILSTSYIIPQYLTTVQNFRELQVGSVLLWIALPQLLLVPIIATVLRVVDARIVLALGLFAIGLACVVATGLTSEWATADFLPSQVLQAFGQSAALIALVFYAVQHLRPADAMTFGVLLQTARLFGGEVGNGFMQTFVRVREQLASNLIGLDVQSGLAQVSGRLDAVAGALAARTVGLDAAQARAISLLAGNVRTQASVISYIDGFTIVAAVAVGMLALTALLRPLPPPGP
jgi:MFS transporter, DHA2 family, multidrug resistance protein